MGYLMAMEMKSFMNWCDLRLRELLLSNNFPLLLLLTYRACQFLGIVTFSSL